MADAIRLSMLMAAMVVAMAIHANAKDSPAQKRITNRFPPPNPDGGTEVSIGVFIMDMEPDEEAGTFLIDAYFRNTWRDPRMAFDASDGDSKQQRLRDGAWDDMWVPDIFVRNAQSVQMFDVPTPQRLMNVKSDGTVYYVYRIRWTLRCPGLEDIPFISGTVLCNIVFESFGYTTDDMYLSWMSTPVDIDRSLNLNGFTLSDKTLFDCTQNYTAGSFTCLDVGFIMEKDLLGKRSLPINLPTMDENRERKFAPAP